MISTLHLRKFCYLEEGGKKKKTEGEIGAKMKEETEKEKRGSKGRGVREVCNNFL